MSIFNLFTSHTVEKHANSIADFLPGGRVFQAKNIEGTNLRNFLLGLSRELQRVEFQLIEFANGIIVDNSSQLIGEWERQLGIPDDCFDGTGTIEVRTQHILAKLASYGAQTADDFINIAEILGITIAVTPGVDFGNLLNEFTLTFPFTFATTDSDLPFIMYVIHDPGDDITVLTCLFDMLKPSHTVVIFIASNLCQIVLTPIGAPYNWDTTAPNHPSSRDSGGIFAIRGCSSNLNDFVNARYNTGPDASADNITRLVFFYKHREGNNGPDPVGLFNFYLFSPSGTRYENLGVTIPVGNVGVDVFDINTTEQGDWTFIGTGQDEDSQSTDEFQRNYLIITSFV